MLIKKKMILKKIMEKKRDRIRRLLGGTADQFAVDSPRRIALEKIRSSLAQLPFDQAHEVMTEVRERLLRVTVEPVQPRVSLIFSFREN